MNILLIWPPSPEYCILNENFTCCEPLGLEYIATPLLNEFSVDIVDMRFESDIISVLKMKKYDVVGLSIPFTVSVNVCNELLKEIKSFNRDLIVVIGGHHPTCSTEYIWMQYVNYVVFGEGVDSFYELITAIRDNRESDNITGIGSVKNGKIKCVQKRFIPDLDNYSLPARHLTEKYRQHYFHAHYKPVVTVRFSRGCPFHCSFCILWKLTDRKYISRSNDSIINELQLIECENIYVVDDEAFIRTDKMVDLANKIRCNNIKKRYHMYVRSDTVAKNPDLMSQWAEIGLDSVFMGLESVFDYELRGYKKNISLDIAYKAVDILHKCGIEIRANFIVKSEYEKEHFKKLKQIAFDLHIDLPTFAILTPFYGTDEYIRLKNQFIIDKLEFFDCYHTFIKTRLPLKQFYSEFSDLFRAAYDRTIEKGREGVFYKGSDNAFEEMLKKMKGSYLYYYEK